MTSTALRLPVPASSAQHPRELAFDHHRLWDKAFRVALREGLGAADAEDVASLTLIDFIEAQTPILHPVAWIALVARRKAWSSRRRVTARAKLLEEHLDVLVPESDAEWSGVETLLDLRAALCSLGHVERSAVLQRDLRGEPLEVIAQTTGLSVETIKRRLKSGRRSLARSLSGRSLRVSLRLTETPETTR